MVVPPHLAQQMESNGHERRRYGRIRTHKLMTQFGEVLDLSASGLRATSHGWRKPKLGSIVDVKLQHRHEVAIVQAQIVWVKRLGLRSYEVGMEFLEVDEGVKQQLMQLTRITLQSIAIAHGRNEM